MRVPRIRLPAGALRTIRELGETAWPHEACGLLEGIGGPGVLVRVARALPCRNVHATPSVRYTIDPEDFLRAEHEARARGLMIVGTWHSHPHGDARPSATDLAEAWPGWSYVIAGVTNARMQSLRCWRLVDERFAEQPIAGNSGEVHSR